MSRLPALFTRNIPSSLSQSSSDANSDSVASPAEQRDDAKRNFLKTMRPLPTQHYWNVYYDRQAKDQQPPKSTDGAEYKAQLVQLGPQIESVQDFWRYNNNTPVDQIKMRESIYLFKAGFKPVWEDRRNINGGSWTFRVPKAVGKDVWTHVQLLAIGEQLQEVLDEGKEHDLPKSNKRDRHGYRLEGTLTMLQPETRARVLTVDTKQATRSAESGCRCASTRT